MNKTFFENLEQRQKDFADRGQVGESIRTEMVLVNGRVFVVDRVIETGDDYVQVDGHDVVDEFTPTSVVLPYHQVSHVVFTKTKPRTQQAGFTSR